MSGPLTPSTTHAANKGASPHAGANIPGAGSAGRFETLRPAAPLPARKLMSVSPGKVHASSTAPREEPVKEPPMRPAALRPAPRHSILKRTGKFARRVAHLCMDAALILVFAPVIAGWLLIERRRRRLQ